MRLDGWFKSTAFSVVVTVAVVCSSASSVQAQQPDATKFNQTYETASAKAREECQTIWADRAFDPIRGKIPLMGEKPTFSMLKNFERLRPKDRPLAELTMKANERCRAAWAPVFAMLPPQVNWAMEGLDRREDALLAKLFPERSRSANTILKRIGSSEN